MKLLGARNIVDYPWNRKFHIPYKKYPKNLGYSSGTMLASLLNRSVRQFDAVIVASAKVDCFEAWLEVADRVGANVPVIFVDGGDYAEIGGDFAGYHRPELFKSALEKRPFDLIFKREYALDATYENNVFPFPMSFNLDRLPTLPAGYKYDVSFWAVETHEVRSHALDILQEKYDCRENGTVRNQVFSRYKRKGSYYLQELAQCRIVLNFRGTGWDTMRYWEVPAVGSFMMTQKPRILIPEDFVDGRDVVHCSDDLNDLTERCDYYLKHDRERERIADSGKRRLYEHHTDVVRARYLLDKLKNLMR